LILRLSVACVYGQCIRLLCKRNAQNQTHSNGKNSTASCSKISGSSKPCHNISTAVRCSADRNCTDSTVCSSNMQLETFLIQWLLLVQNKVNINLWLNSYYERRYICKHSVSSELKFESVRVCA